jgi:hypothetical protein
MTTQIDKLNPKSEIRKLWLKNFPSLKVFGADKLYKIVGPFIIGIELINLPRIKEYKPHFVLFPLYGNNLGNDLKNCLKYPKILFQLYKKNGLQYNIPYEGQLDLHIEAIQSAKKIEILNLNSDVPIKLIYKIIDEQLQDKIIIIRQAQPDLLELKYYTALYIKNKNIQNSVLTDIMNDYKNWNTDYFLKDYGDFTDWYERLKNTELTDFENLIKSNKNETKIKKLLSFEIENEEPSIFKR